jgi:hypothetical protein
MKLSSVARKWGNSRVFETNALGEDAFRKWLDRRAQSVRKRDRRRSVQVLSLSAMNAVILTAIERSTIIDTFSWYILTRLHIMKKGAR